MNSIAQVRVREPKLGNSLIAVTGDNKPEVTSEIQENWQRLLNMVARLLDVPSALIMKIHVGEIEVFMKDEGNDNPYEIKETAQLGDGLYCETVLGTRKPLLVPNSLESPTCQDNPDV